MPGAVVLATDHVVLHMPEVFWVEVNEKGVDKGTVGEEVGDAVLDLACHVGIDDGEARFLVASGFL